MCKALVNILFVVEMLNRTPLWFRFLISSLPAHMAKQNGSRSWIAHLSFESIPAFPAYATLK